MNKDNGSTSILILSVILFLVGIINISINILNCKNYHMPSIILGFVPFCIVIIRNWINSSDTVGNYKVINSYVVGFIVFILIADIICVNILEWSTINTNVASYEKILRIDKYPTNKQISHFPSSIPSDAKEVELKEWEGLGQGKMGMLLSYKISKEEVEYSKLIKIYDKAKYKAQNINEYENIKKLIKIPAEVESSLGLKDGVIPPKDFKLYFIDNTPSEEWNHGYSYGVAINNDISKVTYFSFSW